MRWRVRLFDGPMVEGSTGEQIRRFRSRKVGALLAYLALRLGSPISREELAEALWPDDEDPVAVANRLRVTLASLRRQLEPPGVPFGSVLDVTTPGCVALRTDEVWCDVIAFEGALSHGDLDEAAKIARRTLLPGYFEDWVQLERLRLDALAERLPLGSDTQPAGLPFDPESLEPLPSRLPLPSYLTRFVGRESEIESLTHLLQANRLVSLTGPGGMGKTRLAVQTVQNVDTPVVFIPLAEIEGSHPHAQIDATQGDEIGTDFDLPRAETPASEVDQSRLIDKICEVLLRSVEVAPSLDQDLLDQVVAFFTRRGPHVLVFDNAEHVVDGVANVVMRLLQACPQIRVLVTSRQRLDISGEAVFTLNPLSPPAKGLSPSELERNLAFCLFVDRARIARPDFGLSESSTAAIAEICRLVDGLPLGIELAAARVIAQSPSQIYETLRTHLTDLHSRQRGLPRRHQSLRACIAGSYEMLAPSLQSFFAQLSEFRGGWTAEAAFHIASGVETAPALEELAVRSLIFTQEAEDGQLRYDFLEAIRQFASEQISDEERRTVRKRHAEYFLTLAAEVDEDDVSTIAPLVTEEENLLFALEFTLPFETVAEANIRVDNLYWKGLAGSLTFAHVKGRQRAFSGHSDRALMLAPSVSDIQLRTRLRNAAYFIVSYRGSLKAVHEIGQALLADGEMHAYAPAIVLAKIILAYAGFQGDRARVNVELAMDAVALARTTGQRVLVWRAVRIAAWTHVARVELDPDVSPAEKLRLLQRGEALSRENLADLPARSSHQTFERLTLAYSLRSQERYVEAYDVLKSAERVGLDHGMLPILMFCFREESLAAFRLGQIEIAAELYGVFLRISEQTGYSHYDPLRDDWRTAPARETLGDLKFQELCDQGSRVPIEVLVYRTLEISDV